MKTVLSLMFCVLGIGFLSGCNTVKGFGEDMQQGGENLQKAASEH